MKVSPPPSVTRASLTVTAALSSFRIVPVPPAPVPPAPEVAKAKPAAPAWDPAAATVTPGGALDTVKLTVKVSLPSNIASAVVDTVKVWVSPFVPLKLRAVVFAV